MMQCFASRTGTRRNLAVMREAGWGILLSPAGVWRTEGFELYGCDNGRWSDHQNGTEEFDGDRFRRFADKFGPQARFLVAPDTVAAGLRSLELTLRWLDYCQSVCRLVLIAVQDGMEWGDVLPLIGPGIGIFLGGSTEWKLAEMIAWGMFCAEHDLYYHIGRVNSIKRIRLAHASGADSFDGTSVTMYAKTLPKLDRASRQSDLLSPTREERDGRI